MYAGHIPQNQIAIIHPDVSLKDKWVEKLKERYDNDPIEKNRRALEFAEVYFENSINDLMEDNWIRHIVIDRVPEDEDYDLDKYISDNVTQINNEYVIKYEVI